MSIKNWQQNFFVIQGEIGGGVPDQDCQMCMATFNFSE